MRETQRANLIVGQSIAIAQDLDKSQAGVAVLGQEADEILSFDERHLTRCQSLSGQLVRTTGDGGARTEHFPRLSYLDDQSLAVGGTGREFRAAGAYQIDPA